MSEQDATPASYRRVLMLLPRGYREQRGEEILGTMLDAAQDEGRSRPTVTDVISILSLSLAVRTGAPGRGARDEAFGTLLRRVALAGLFLESAIAVVRAFGFAQEADFYWRATPLAGSSLMHDLAVAGLEQAAEQATVVLATSLALVLLITGRKRSGLALAAVGSLSAVVGIGLHFGDASSLGLNRPVNGAYLATFTLGLLPLIAGALGFHRADRRSARPWIVTLGTIDGVLLLVMAVISETHAVVPGIQFVLGSMCVLPAVGFAVRAGRVSPSWPLALIVISAPGLALLPRTITDLGAGGPTSNSGVSGAFDALGELNLIGAVLFAGILAWSLYRRRATRAILSR